MSQKTKMSSISRLHYFKLYFRSALLLGVLIFYIAKRAGGSRIVFAELADHPALMALIGFIGVIVLVEMIFRFFPSSLESMGCQKQFAKNYIPREGAERKKGGALPVLMVALAWILLNGAIGALYFLSVIDDGILFLVSLFYAVCDMICILFFCPFQTWFMKNKCCGSCRIYNWDYAMMFTPLVFIPHYFTWGLLGVALLLLFFWEIAAHLHPERFDEQTNECLSCAHCKEKLCHHKSQLRTFLRKNRERLRLKGNAVVEKVKHLTKK